MLPKQWRYAQARRFAGLARQVRFVRAAGGDWAAAIRVLASDPRAELVLPGNGVALRAKTSDIDVFIDIFGNQSFAPASDALDGTPEGLPILDGGAYTGISTRWLAQRFPGRTIVAVEPNSENFGLLLRNTRDLPNVLPVNAAISTHDGEGPLIARGRDYSFSIVSNPADTENPIAVETVRHVSIKSLLQRAESTGFALIKLDIEGGEANLLAERGTLLGCTHFLLVELHERIVPGVEDSFREATRGLGVVGAGEKHLVDCRRSRIG